MLGDASPALAAALRSRRAIELRYAPGGSAEALREVEEAIALARRSGDPGALAAALEDASLVRWSVEDPEAWLALNREIAAAAREANDTELLFQGVKGIATAHLELGERPAFDEEMERCEQIAAAHPSPLLRAVVSGLRGARAFLDGDLDAAERFAIEGASAGRDSVTPLAAGQLYYHRLETGRLAETLDAVRSFAAESPGIAIWPIASARALVACGRTNEARAALRSVGRLATIPKDRNWLSAVALFAESAVLLGDRDAMREAREALAPHARVNVVMGNGSLFAGQTAHYLGMLCTALGERREAKAYFDRALRMHRAMRSEPWCLRTQAEQLHLAASEADAPPDPSAAASTIERAEALGMVSCADRARAAIEGTGEGG